MNNFDKNLGKNPTLISLSDLNSLSSTNLVGVDNFKKIFETTNFSFSSRLLNYIEPEIFKGIERTVFYSGINTEFNKGDKVFILNGNYDSNSYIKTNKYDLDSDGYEVLDIDNGRIVLDVKYDKDKLPYTEVVESDVVNVYYVSNTDELEQVTSNTSISGVKKFDNSLNNIIYYDGSNNYQISNIFDPSYSGLTGSGATYSGPTSSEFNQINGYEWANINNDFLSGTSSFLDKKIKIINSDFGDYKKGFVYKFENGVWIPSIENLVPIISKTNFRGGKILGSFNSGVYGKSESVLEWNNPDAEWGGGFLYNSNWIDGDINSLDTGINSFTTRLENGVPVEESINPNNNGFGYNYILNSNIKGGVINNGNIINSIVDGNLSDSVVKDYLQNVISTTSSSLIEVNGGLFLESNIEDSILKNSKVKNSKVNNVLFDNGLSINSQIESSVFKNSTYVTDDVIRILNVVGGDVNIYIKKYKFEIFKESYDKLELGDFFYIKGLIFTKDPNPINFFHLKFRLSTWVETFDYINGANLSQTDLKITSFLSDENDKYFVNILFEDDSNISFPSFNDIDVTNAFILDSNYESGLFESSDWNSGFNINYNKNNISNNNDSGDYKLVIQSGDLKVQNMVEVEKNEIVFLNSIEHTDTLGEITRLSDTYVVDSVNGLLKEFPFNNILSNITTSTDFFKTGNGYNRKGYLHKLKFKESKIKSGIFKRTYLNNCLIENKSYDSSDKDFSDIRNIRSLLIDESVFHNNSNFLSSATYFNCLISKKEDVFINGIVYNSIWDGGVFNKGVFKESTWIDGVFNDGLFYKNRTFDSNPTLDKPSIFDYRINSLYKSGKFPNNRYSWQKGTFNKGEMVKSDWETGVFNDGNFIESKFYDGVINGGIIGNKSIDDFKTRIYQATINNTKVENAYLFTEDYEFSKTTPREITWNNGVFEKGIFGSRDFINELCFNKPSGNITLSENIDYLFISNNNSSYRLDIINQSDFKYNLTYSDDTKLVDNITSPTIYYENNIKSISDSLGNLIEITFDVRSTNTPPSKFGRVIKYSKNSGIYTLKDNSEWIIEADDYLKDVYIDSDDNLYVCYQTKIEKWTSDKKLIWSVNNNVNNVAIDGDDEFIYVNGLVGNGYIEKLDKDGGFKWRTSLDYNYTSTYLQKIISYGDFILVNGVFDDTTTLNYKIYKLNKLNGNLDITHSQVVNETTPGIDINDYTYNDIDNKIILTNKDGFNTIDINTMSLTTTTYTSVNLANDRCSNIEYYNDYIYVRNYDTSLSNESKIYKLDKNTFVIKQDVELKGTIVYDYYDNVIYNKFTVRENGFKYSQLELISPTDANGILSTGSNIFIGSNQNSIDFDLKNIEFEVNKISFNYSVKQVGYFGPTHIPSTHPDFSIYQNSLQLSSTQSMITASYSVINDNSDDKYIYASDWVYYEESVTSSDIGDDFKLRIDNLLLSDTYEVKISQFCVYSKEGEMKSIWNDGSFNGGQFVENGQWNDGSFNGGLFLSTYGIDDISKLNTAYESQFEYGWKNGKFNGGEFGNGQIENNSSWENGEFNGGVFKGKLWNNGIFTNGKFEGGIDVPILGTDNSSSYVNSIFDGLSIDYESTRGIWNDGYVTAKKDRFVKDKKLFTDLRKKESENKVVLFEDVVFESGTFSHENGVMKDSIWLGGTFESGTFEDSVFNPFRSGKFNTLDTCIWENGLFKGGDFYYSKWNGGLFNTGNAYGMIWNGGICNYMNAYNILWRSGTWKNGNWFGSDFEFDGTTPDDFKTKIMDRINSEYNNTEYHLWNVFDNKISTNVSILSASASNDIR
jgi:hypothetical protein